MMTRRQPRTRQLQPPLRLQQRRQQLLQLQEMNIGTLIQIYRKAMFMSHGHEKTNFLNHHGYPILNKLA